ncbi:glycosyl hydrolase [Streptomyces sp. L7]
MNTAPGHGFWWAGHDPAVYQRLWRATYDHLVTRRGLHNLIFVWSPNSWDGSYGRGRRTPTTPAAGMWTWSVSTTTAAPAEAVRAGRLDGGLVPRPGRYRRPRIIASPSMSR